jgi:hypothetical protein
MYDCHIILVEWLSYIAKCFLTEIERILQKLKDFVSKIEMSYPAFKPNFTENITG